MTRELHLLPRRVADDGVETLRGYVPPCLSSAQQAVDLHADRVDSWTTASTLFDRQRSEARAAGSALGSKLRRGHLVGDHSGRPGNGRHCWPGPLPQRGEFLSRWRDRRMVSTRSDIKLEGDKRS